jgi:hypothetical protein
MSQTRFRHAPSVNVNVQAWTPFKFLVADDEHGDAWKKRAVVYIVAVMFWSCAFPLVHILMT